MQDQGATRQKSQAQDEGVSGRLERIEEIKEALKHVHGMADEMSLLSDLNQEIIALRRLRDPQY